MAHQLHLEKEKYRQWMKAGLGLRYLQEVLAPFCDDVAKQQHIEMLYNIKQTKNLQTLTCGQCALRTLKPDHVKIGKNQCPLGQAKCNCCYTSGKIACPNNLCGAIYDSIITSHASRPPTPYWKNTQTQLWTGDPWSLAKCFINAPGYDQKTSAADTDCLGLLLMIINNKYFRNHIACEITGTDVFSKVRRYRNEIFHSCTMELEKADANTYIDNMIDVLQDDKKLIYRKDAQDAVKRLEELKNDFVITVQVEADAVHTVNQSVRDAIGELEKKLSKLTIVSSALGDQDEIIKSKLGELSPVIEQGETSHKNDPTNDSPLIFLSYHWGRQSEVKALYGRLKSHGYTIWMDIYQMGGGDKMYHEIYRGLRGCKVVIACVTQKYAQSDNCQREVSLADTLKKPIIPLLLEEMKWPPHGSMSMIFTELLYINVYRDPDVQRKWTGQKFEELIGQLKKYKPDRIDEGPNVSNERDTCKSNEPENPGSDKH